MIRNRPGLLFWSCGRSAVISLLSLFALMGCAEQPTLTRTDICLPPQNGSGQNLAVLICVLFENNTEGHLCPSKTLFEGQDMQSNKPKIKKGTGPQKLAWQAVTWDEAGGEHKKLDVLYKVAFDPFTGAPINVTPPTGNDGFARTNQALGNCSDYNGPCIADPGRGSSGDPDYRKPKEVEYKYTIQKWKRVDNQPAVDTDCPPLDPVFRVML